MSTPIDMELQCDICFQQFNLEDNRPKSLPCGHTICRECLQNPAFGMKCPNCRKHLATDPGGLPDNFSLIRVMEKDGAPARKVARREDPKVQQLQRGVDAGRRVVQVLRQAIPMAVEALHRQLDSSVAHLRDMESALDKLLRGEQGGDEGELQGPTPDLAVKRLRMEDSLRLLSTDKCTVVAEEGATTWGASVELGRMDDVLRLLLLQLRADSQLQKVVDPEPLPSAAYVGPPRIPILTIAGTDLGATGHLKVNDILRDGHRWRNIRTLNNLKGSNSEELLRVMAPHLEELKILGSVGPTVLEEVQKMPLLKTLIVKCSVDEEDDFPDLPPQLEQLAIYYPTENQLQSVLRMPRLRSLMVHGYHAEEDNWAFPPSQHGALLWLGLQFHVDQKDTMMSLLRAFAASVQELQVTCVVGGDDPAVFSFPELGPDLAACAPAALRRLVLHRPLVRCTQVGACMLQLQTVRGFLPPNASVFCDVCHKSVL
ncbi:uncharacterized protein LOC113217160 [Frankliniella occidentalis]|uniref:Uncharacterized protein LOC113217160 n=1 Tax=Frankliniella occidentalis TaxID=133901 RepID=A0A6J1TJ46_FRAOC|nr:uncharacterized protein LOC113217160 [Frankliniella occidentalis]